MSGHQGQEQELKEHCITRGRSQVTAVTDQGLGIRVSFTCHYYQHRTMFILKQLELCHFHCKQVKGLSKSKCHYFCPNRSYYCMPFQSVESERIIFSFRSIMDGRKDSGSKTLSNSLNCLYLSRYIRLPMPQISGRGIISCIYLPSAATPHCSSLPICTATRKVRP